MPWVLVHGTYFPAMVWVTEPLLLSYRMDLNFRGTTFCGFRRFPAIQERLVPQKFRREH